MKKFDWFFFTIIALILSLSGIYYYSSNNLDQFENNAHLRAQIERQKSLVSLKKKLEKIAKLKKNQQRQIASIPTPAKIDFEFETENVIDAEILAKKFYIQAKSKCYEENQEFECIKILETAVSQFPQSEWTAESLVLLSDFYYRTKRMSQVREILNVLKTEFKNNKSIQSKVNIIERHLL
jgi:TolA-binding protein